MNDLKSVKLTWRSIGRGQCVLRDRDNTFAMVQSLVGAAYYCTVTWEGKSCTHGVRRKRTAKEWCLSEVRRNLQSLGLDCELVTTLEVNSENLDRELNPFA